MKAISFIVALVGFCGCCLFAQANLDSGLVVYYPFNGTAVDESGNGNNGTVFGATPTMDRFGNDSSAYAFDGIDDYIAYPVLWAGSPSALTMAAWVYYMPTQVEGKIVYHGGNGEFQLYAIDTTASAAAHLTSGWYFSTASIIPNTWYFLVGVWEQGGSLRLYLDGVLVDSLAVPNEQLLNVGTNFPPSIGSYAQATAHFFTGWIDDIRIYDRALKNSQIDSLYHNYTSSVAIPINAISKHFEIDQNYPNPFNPTTNIAFRMSDVGVVIVRIYDILGREVRTLVNERKPSGRYVVQWDGQSDTGVPMAGGMYFYRLQVGHRFVQTRQMLLMR